MGWRGGNTTGVAFDSVTLGDLDEFIDRWMGWFADAANGRLQIPSMMPERPTPRNWRQK
jgi:serine/threonine-protein kinase